MIKSGFESVANGIAIEKREEDVNLTDEGP